MKKHILFWLCIALFVSINNGYAQEATELDNGLTTADDTASTNADELSDTELIEQLETDADTDSNAAHKEQVKNDFGDEKPITFKMTGNIKQEFSIVFPDRSKSDPKNLKTNAGFKTTADLDLHLRFFNTGEADFDAKNVLDGDKDKKFGAYIELKDLKLEFETEDMFNLNAYTLKNLAVKGDFNAGVNLGPLFLDLKSSVLQGSDFSFNSSINGVLDYTKLNKDRLLYLYDSADKRHADAVKLGENAGDPNVLVIKSDPERKKSTNYRGIKLGLDLEQLKANVYLASHGAPLDGLFGNGFQMLLGLDGILKIENLAIKLGYTIALDDWDLAESKTLESDAISGMSAGMSVSYDLEIMPREEDNSAKGMHLIPSISGLFSYGGAYRTQLVKDVLQTEIESFSDAAATAASTPTGNYKKITDAYGKNDDGDAYTPMVRHDIGFRLNGLVMLKLGANTKKEEGVFSGNKYSGVSIGYVMSYEKSDASVRYADYRLGLGTLSYNKPEISVFNNQLRLAFVEIAADGLIPVLGWTAFVELDNLGGKVMVDSKNVSAQAGMDGIKFHAGLELQADLKDVVFVYGGVGMYNTFENFMVKVGADIKIIDNVVWNVQYATSDTGFSTVSSSDFGVLSTSMKITL